MKIIDLYNMVANNEKLPKKIIYKNCIFENRSVIDYWCKEAKICLDELIFMQNLNDEVEILEEENKMPEKLPKSVTDNAGSSKDMRLIAITLNQMIDYLKSKGE